MIETINFLEKWSVVSKDHEMDKKCNRCSSSTGEDFIHLQVCWNIFIEFDQSNYKKYLQNQILDFDQFSWNGNQVFLVWEEWISTRKYNKSFHENEKNIHKICNKREILLWRVVAFLWAIKLWKYSKFNFNYCRTQWEWHYFHDLLVGDIIEGKLS